MRLLIVGMMLLASIAMAGEKRRDDDVRTFKPKQETIKVMNHVFEILR